MGRRSRKRSVSGEGRRLDGEGPEPRVAPAAASRAERDAERRRLRGEGESSKRGGGARRGTRERPRPPWGAFPLTELVVLVSLVLVIGGFVIPTSSGQLMLLAGFALGSLAGLELAVREHFAGYRSHTTLLSACAGFAAGAVVLLAITGLAAPVPAVLVALAVSAVAFYLLREAFKRRSGGLGFR